MFHWAVLFWHTPTAVFSLLPHVPLITLPKVIIWHFGKTLMRFILCPDNVFVVVALSLLMKPRNTLQLTGEISPIYLMEHTRYVLTNFMPISSPCRGSKIHRRIVQWWIKY